MNTLQLNQLKEALKTPQRVVIIPHKNPDGDAIGSCLGWMHFLKKFGHQVSVISPNEYPQFLQWIPGNESVCIYNHDQDQFNTIIKQASIIFTLDFNALNRIAKMGAVVEQSDALKVMIDHHREPEGYANISFSYPELGSTCEVVYHIIEALEHTDIISKEIATCLYVGILTDSGSFRFPSVTAKTHRIVATLIEKGADHVQINDNIKDTATLDRLQLIGKALNNIHYISELRTAYVTLSQEELNSFNYQKGDTEGLVNYGLSIQNCVFSVIMIENKKEGIIKMSFRSKGNFSVNEFARQHFDGGGHHNAAGGRSEFSLNKTCEHFLAVLNNYKEALK